MDNVMNICKIIEEINEDKNGGFIHVNKYELILIHRKFVELKERVNLIDKTTIKDIFNKLEYNERWAFDDKRRFLSALFYCNEVDLVKDNMDFFKYKCSSYIVERCIFFKANDIIKLFEEKFKDEFDKDFIFLHVCKYANYDLFMYMLDKYNLDVNDGYQHPNIDYIETFYSGLVHYTDTYIKTYDRNITNLIKMIDIFFERNIKEELILQDIYCIENLTILEYVCDKFEKKFGNMKEKIMNTENLLKYICQFGEFDLIMYLKRRFNLDFKCVNGEYIPIPWLIGKHEKVEFLKCHLGVYIDTKEYEDRYKKIQAITEVVKNNSIDNGKINKVILDLLELYSEMK